MELNNSTGKPHTGWFVFAYARGFAEVVCVHRPKETFTSTSKVHLVEILTWSSPSSTSNGAGYLGGQISYE